jgi:hypothetical protein
MKQTAVEWLKKEFEDYGSSSHLNLDWTTFDELCEQAKAMEKEQHDKTAEEWWKEGAHYMESGGRAKWESFEQYYNETFKQQEL